MYAVRQHKTGTRMVGATTAVAMTVLMAWALVSVANRKIVAPIPKAMIVSILQAPDKPAPPKPIPDKPKIEPKLDTPPPIIVPPEIPVVEEPAIVAVPEPAAPPTPPMPDTRPQLVARDKPPYPIAAIRAQEQGDTTLTLCVNAAGRVTDSKILRSSGHASLDDAALKWMSRARFKPAMLNGKPAAMCNYNITYSWNLRDRS
ncbi:MAG: TonB family protein [Alphaproteobacteria bacterium]|nr:TonB family protein [Alphaproteobacteria bacterium]